MLFRSYQADWLSQQKDWLSGEDKETWENHKSEFRVQLDKHLKPSDIDPSQVSGQGIGLSDETFLTGVIGVQYGIFFASAGHASLIDYPDAKGLQDIAAKMYTEGGIISAV